MDLSCGRTSRPAVWPRWIGVADQTLRNFGQKARRNIVASLSVQHARLPMTQIQPVAGARDRDVHQPALFLNTIGLVQAVLVRKQTLLQPAHEYGIELQA